MVVLEVTIEMLAAPFWLSTAVLRFISFSNGLIQPRKSACHSARGSKIGRPREGVRAKPLSLGWVSQELADPIGKLRIVGILQKMVLVLDSDESLTG